MAYGLGLRIEGYECQTPDVLNDETKVKDLLQTAISVAGMSLMAGPYASREKPRDIGKGPGITACAILYESHVVIHTYPEQRWFLFEITSCKDFVVSRVENLLRAWAECRIDSKCEPVGRFFPEPTKAP